MYVSTYPIFWKQTLCIVEITKHLQKLFLLQNMVEEKNLLTL